MYVCVCDVYIYIYLQCVLCVCVIYAYMYIHICKHTCIIYEVATISRILKIIGLFEKCRSLFWGSFAKETCNFEEPTNRSHPIEGLC